MKSKPVPTKEDYEIAAKHGIRKSTVYQRIYYGMTLEEAITKPLQNRSFSRKYQKYIELAKQNGISYPTFHARLTKKTSRKWTPEEAATIPPLKSGRPRIIKMNYQFPTDEEIKQAASIDVSEKLLNQRLRKGWEMERAITSPVGTSYEGLEKHTKLLKLAKRTGISESTFYRRIREGMTPYQAASTPKEEKYVEYVTLAEQNGIAPKTFYKRVERNMEPLEAATKPAKKRKKTKQIS
jgi:predicted DNA-binding transcriptional regulator AlpA